MADGIIELSSENKILKKMNEYNEKLLEQATRKLWKKIHHQESVEYRNKRIKLYRLC